MVSICLATANNKWTAKSHTMSSVHMYGGLIYFYKQRADLVICHLHGHSTRSQRHLVAAAKLEATCECVYTTAPVHSHCVPASSYSRVCLTTLGHARYAWPYKKGQRNKKVYGGGNKWCKVIEVQKQERLEEVIEITTNLRLKTNDLLELRVSCDVETEG